MNLNQSYGFGGSVNSANSAGWSQSGTMANDARNWSMQAANTAYQNNLDAMHEQMAFNAAEAQKQRDWQERMANTIYTRSVANMKEAGINPILAANMGLSGAAVGSGATASIGGGGYSPLAQNYMDSWSASQNASESRGSSWSSSEGGLVTALTALGNAIGGALAGIQAGNQVSIAIDGLNRVVDHYSNVGDNKGQNGYGEEGYTSRSDLNNSNYTYYYGDPDYSNHPILEKLNEGMQTLANALHGGRSRGNTR